MRTSPASIFVLALGAAGLLWPGRTAAQGSVAVTVTTTTVAFATPGVSDFDAGWIDHPGVDVAIQSRPGNRPWELRIRGTAPAGKPFEQLLWRTAGSTSWTSLTETDATVLIGTGDQTATLQFRMLLSWAGDPPGSHSMGLELTALRL